MGRKIPAKSLFLSAAVICLAAAPAVAGDGDNNNDTSFYKATFGRVLEGFGLKSADDDKTINYRERSPLVLPSNETLPPPEKADVVSNPAWPKDPDVKRRKLIAEEKKGRMTSDQREHEQNPLSPSELAPGPRPRGVQAVVSGDPDRKDKNSDFTDILSPSALGYKGGLLGKMFHGGDDDVAKFTGEPPRTSLTEPPAGYQTPSPDQPYGVTNAKAKVVDDYATRAELKR